jgi:uncharacterized short protein YbdD (DUF466 family)
LFVKQYKNYVAKTGHLHPSFFITIEVIKSLTKLDGNTVTIEEFKRLSYEEALLLLRQQFRAANVIEATGRIEREIPEMRIKNPQYCEVYEVKNYLEFFRERLGYIGREYLGEDNKKLRDVYVSKLRPQITSQYVREAKPQNIIIATEKAVEHAKIIAPIFKTMHVLPDMKRGNKNTPNMFSNIGKRKFDNTSDTHSKNKPKKSKLVEKPYCSHCKTSGHHVNRCNIYPSSTIDKNQREAHLFCK